MFNFPILVPKYDEGGGEPPELPPTDRGGWGWSFPEWAKYSVAFYVGYVLWYLPWWAAAGAVFAMLGFSLFAGFRRWR